MRLCRARFCLACFTPQFHTYVEIHKSTTHLHWIWRIMRTINVFVQKLVTIYKLSELSGIPVRSLRTLVQKKILSHYKLGHRTNEARELREDSIMQRLFLFPLRRSGEFWNYPRRCAETLPVRYFWCWAYSRVSLPNAGEIAHAPTQTKPEERSKTYNATKIKGTSHEGC